MKLLGIDPGLTIGWGGIEALPDGDRYIAGGGHTGYGAHLHDKLADLAYEVGTLKGRFHVEAVAIEDMFVSPRVITSAVKVGKAYGAMVIGLTRQGLLVVDYTPSAIKKAVGAPGNAKKDRVRAEVVGLLDVPTTWESHRYDALAAAIALGATLREQGQLG